MIRYVRRPNGLDEPLAYTGDMDAQWQPKWEDLTVESQATMIDIVNQIRAAMPIEIVDVQLVASRAMGTCAPDSDYDIILVPANIDLIPSWGGSHRYELYHDAIDLIATLTDQYKIVSQMRLGLDARGLVCYSFGDGRWYGKIAGEVLQKKVKFNYKTQQRELFDL